MGLAQLFFRKNNEIGSVSFDAVLSEGATADTEITSNPVEKGADMNDHIIVKPMTFFVKGVVSNASSNLVGQVFAVIDRFTLAKSKSERTWDELLKLQSSKTPFTYVQGLKSYKNVVIKTLNESQDKDTSNGLFFDAVLQQVNIPGVVVDYAEKYDDASILDSAIPTTNGGFKQLESIA